MELPRLFLGIALFIATAFAFTPRLPACDCVPPSPETAFAGAAAVFSGRVAAIVEVEFRHRVFVDVFEVWKGPFVEGSLQRVDTNSSGASCGFSFEIGEEYLIYADDNSGALFTHICGLTGAISGIEEFGLGDLDPEVVNSLNVEFRRGDVNGDGEIDISDPIYGLLVQFLGAFEPPCLEALDFENNGVHEIADAVAALEFLFLAGAPPAAPFPSCGKDLEPLDCKRYPLCPLKSDTNEIVRVERVAEGVEIEVSSSRPFIPRALFPILCLGTQAFWRSRTPEGGSLNSLIFTLTEEEFEAARDPSLITVQHGDQCLNEFLDQMRLYWDLWVFDPVELLVE